MWDSNEHKDSSDLWAGEGIFITQNDVCKSPSSLEESKGQFQDHKVPQCDQNVEESIRASGLWDFLVGLLPGSVSTSKEALKDNEYAKPLNGSKREDLEGAYGEIARKGRGFVHSKYGQQEGTAKYLYLGVLVAAIILALLAVAGAVAVFVRLVIFNRFVPQEKPPKIATSTHPILNPSVGQTQQYNQVEDDKLSEMMTYEDIPRSDNGYEYRSLPMKLENPNPPVFHAESPKRIKTVQDLQSIGPHTTWLIVESLTSSNKPGGLSLAKVGGIKQLELVGPISPAWLKYLISSLPQLETLRVNFDKVCSGFPIDNLGLSGSGESILLENVHTLIMTDSNSCPIFDWGFRIEMTGLISVEVIDSTLKENEFKGFLEVLAPGAGTIRDILIAKSYICDECDLTELQFDSISSAKITQMRGPLGG